MECKMKITGRITHRAHGWVGVACLALLVACGGGEGDDSDPVVPARAGSADIGSSGGSVDAELEGGATVELVVPNGALATTTTLRIDPVAAANGSLGAFTISLADFIVQAPVTLVTLEPHADL
jgi:hypothetical protein